MYVINECRINHLKENSLWCKVSFNSNSKKAIKKKNQFKSCYLFIAKYSYKRLLFFYIDISTMFLPLSAENIEFTPLSLESIF
jgi:hypothetical protein